MPKFGDRIHQSSRPAINSQIPSDPDHLSLVSFLLDRTSSFPDRHALVDAATGRTLTFFDLHSSIRRVSHNLIARHGVKKKDVILIFSPNSVDFMVAFLGIVASGAIATTVNPQYTVAELKKQVGNDKYARRVFLYP